MLGIANLETLVGLARRLVQSALQGPYGKTHLHLWVLLSWASANGEIDATKTLIYCIQYKYMMVTEQN